MSRSPETRLILIRVRRLRGRDPWSGPSILAGRRSVGDFSEPARVPHERLNSVRCEKRLCFVHSLHETEFNGEIRGFA